MLIAARSCREKSVLSFNFDIIIVLTANVIVKEISNYLLCWYLNFIFPLTFQVVIRLIAVLVVP
jgi:hypothetical protein